MHSGCQLDVFSDGVFEIEKSDGMLWTIEEFERYLRDVSDRQSRLDMTWQHVHALHGRQALQDDFTIVEVTF